MEPFHEDERIVEAWNDRTIAERPVGTGGARAGGVHEPALDGGQERDDGRDE